MSSELNINTDEPHHPSKRPALLWLFGALALALLIAGLVRVVVYGPAVDVGGVAQVHIGAEARLVDPAHEGVFLATNLVALDKLNAALAADDASAFRRLVADDQLFVVAVGTRCAVLTDDEPGAYLVRVLEGPENRRKGYVPRRFVAP